MNKLQENVTFSKQSDGDIEFSNIGQTAGCANCKVFKPLWMQTPAHMQFTAGCLTEKRVVRFYNQISIHLKLEAGDSGTCIYVVQHPNKNGCIGMAIAMCGGLTVVTPLKDIFKEMSI